MYKFVGFDTRRTGEKVGEIPLTLFEANMLVGGCLNR